MKKKKEKDKTGGPAVPQGDWDIFVRVLLSWFAAGKRDLPWRHTQDPYAIWISEVMLQQTRVSTAIPYFKKFLEEFPTVDSLAKAPLEKVLKRWEGLGYYSRARNLHATACEIQAKYGGEFPGNSETLRTFPGIGRYTANAVASIAFGEAVPVVDGNVWRVFSRILADGSAPEKGKKRVYEFLQGIISEKDPSSFNQAVMELGSLICAVKNPKCFLCPVQSFCAAFQKNQVLKYPRKMEKRSLPQETWLTVIAYSRDEVLLRQRPLQGLWGGLWEFPSMPARIGESHEKSLSRFLKNLKLSGKKIQPLSPLRHSFSHFKLTLVPFSIRIREREHQDGLIWTSWKENPYPMPSPHLKLFSQWREQGFER